MRREDALHSVKGVFTPHRRDVNRIGSFCVFFEDADTLTTADAGMNAFVPRLTEIFILLPRQFP